MCDYCVDTVDVRQRCDTVDALLLCWHGSSLVGARFLESCDFVALYICMAWYFSMVVWFGHEYKNIMYLWQDVDQNINHLIMPQFIFRDILLKYDIYMVQL